MLFRAKRFQLVELKVPAGVTGTNQQINFLNQPQLQSISGGRTVYVEAIETFNVNDVPLSPFTPGQPIASEADMINGLLTLSVDTGYDFQYIPLATLHRTLSQQTSDISPVVGQLYGVNQVWQIDWTKSYVTMVGAPTITAFSYLFGVYYRYSTDKEATTDAQMALQLNNLQQQVNTAFGQLQNIAAYLKLG